MIEMIKRTSNMAWWKVVKSNDKCQIEFHSNAQKYVNRTVIERKTQYKMH